MENVQVVEKNGLNKTKRFVKVAVLLCPECKNEVYGTVCKNCGLVFESKPVTNLQKRSLKDDVDNRTNGWRWSYSSLEDATTHSDKTSNPELKKAFKREHVNDSKFGRKYLNGYYEIKKIVGNLRLSRNISDTAIYLLRTLIEREYMVKTRRRYAIFAALVIIGSRLNNIPFRYEQVYEHTPETPKSIKSAYYSIVNELKIKIPKFTLVQYIIHHCNLLGIYSPLRQTILYTTMLIEKEHISGKDPVGYSAAIIRHVTGISRKTLSKKLFVSAPVITWRYNEIKGFLK